MKRTFITIMMCLLFGFAADVSAEIKQNVTNGIATNSSEIIIALTDKPNSLMSVALINSGVSSMLILGYLSDRLDIFNHTPLEFKIDNGDIIKTDYFSQRSQNLASTSSPLAINMGMFSLSKDVKNRISTAKTLTLRAYSTVSDIVYTVPDSMLQEWKYIISTPLIAGYQSLYKNITWPKRGCPNIRATRYQTGKRCL
jgi:hypothetical protein